MLWQKQEEAGSKTGLRDTGLLGQAKLMPDLTSMVWGQRAWVGWAHRKGSALEAWGIRQSLHDPSRQ